MVKLISLYGKTDFSLWVIISDFNIFTNLYIILLL